jgi:hypothetical protein
MYLHCPRCRLAIKCRVDNPIPVNCRRCLARAAIAVPVFASQLNGAELRAADGGDGTSGRLPQPLRRERGTGWTASSP